MIFDRALDGALGQRSKVVLLRLLVRTRAEKHGRELARLLGLDHKTCHKALRELARQGIIQTRRAGTCVLYRINDRHAVVKQMLEPLFEREAGMLAAYVRDLLRRLRGRVECAILFGSVARGQQRAGSDVDVALITRDVKSSLRVRDRVGEAAVELAVRYGNPPQVIVLDRPTFARKARQGDPFVSEVMRSGRVVSGKPIPEVLKNGG